MLTVCLSMRLPVTLVYSCFLFFVVLVSQPCGAQRLQTISPDGTVFESVVVGQYVSVMLPNRFGTTARYAARITDIRPDSITLALFGRTQVVPVRDILGLRRVSKASATIRRSSKLLVPGAISLTGNIVGGLTKEQPGVTRLLLTVGSSAAAGTLLLAVIRIPGLKRAKNGYSFRVE